MLKHQLFTFLIIVSAIFSSCQKETFETNTVYIKSAVSTPTESESVTIKNKGGETKDLTDWTIGDTNDPKAYIIPSGTILDQGQTKTFNKSTINFQINDSGEVLYLKDNYGVLVDTWSN